MNFKPTTWKIIISAIIGIIIGIYPFSKMIYTGSTGPAYVFGLSSVIGFLISFIVIYVVWSLIEKKKRK